MAQAGHPTRAQLSFISAVIAQVRRLRADEPTVKNLRRRIVDGTLRRMPARVLDRTRLGAMLVGSLALLGNLVEIAGSHRTNSWHIAPTVPLIVLTAAVVFTYVRGRAGWWDPLLLPALTVLSGSGLIDPMSTVGIIIPLLVAQSLYGSVRMWALRSIGLMAALPAAVAMSAPAAGQTVTWDCPTVIGVLPQLAMMCLMMRGIHAALQRQERASAREAVLARTGNRLLGSTELADVRTIGAEAAQELAALSPGIATLLLERAPGGLRVTRVTGLPAALIGVEMPGSIEATPDLLAAAAPGVNYWQAIDLGADRHLLIGGARPVAVDLVDSFRTLAHQVVLGETSCRSHAELSHRADHDDLTRLPTRALLFQRLAAAVDTGEPGTGALLNIDLDDFKQINDIYGHGAGDELLVAVAERLAEVCGPNSLAARFGGDEFAVLLTELTDPAEAERIATQVCESIIAPLRLSTVSVSVGASIGVAVAEPQVCAADLMRCADIAMYSAKAQGKNRVEKFTADQHGTIARHRMLEDHLSSAAERDEIELHYQPYLDLNTGAVAGVEAVASWRHPTLGVLSLDELLPLAERTGDLTAVGRHIVRSACTQLATLPGGATMNFGINVAASQLLDPGFTDMVMDALTDAGLSPQRLTLEIIETEQIDDTAAGDQLHRLADLGVRIALDDFGTGYVSFASLRSFPIHQLKVDRSFLVGGDDRALDMVLSVGQILGIHTVVQGVADADEIARLRRTTVTAIQGDLLAAPMPVQDLAGWLAAGPSPAMWPALRIA
jgi:diguanylate cyclase (GGDEF)-like protein